MPGNTFGQLFRLTTWGESHGPAVGCVVDGCPAGLPLAEADLQRDLDRRRVGQSRVSSARQEADQVQILSGVFEGRTTGTPISMLVWNGDAKSSHYDSIKDLYRPGHADFTWDANMASATGAAAGDPAPARRSGGWRLGRSPSCCWRARASASSAGPPSWAICTRR